MLAVLFVPRHRRWRFDAPSLMTLAVLAAVCLLCQATPSHAAPPILRVIDTIVIDPGHGGSNEGARGSSGETLEKEEVLKIALKVRDRLKRDYPDLEVILTRTEDTELSLTDRIHVANEHEADLFLSLHLNSTTRADASGVEVFYLRPDMTMPLVTNGEGSWGQDFDLPEQTDAPVFGPTASELPLILADLELGSAHGDSSLWAEVLLSELAHIGSGRANRGVRQANFGVLRGARVPAVVVELGFVSNPIEEKWLCRNQTHLATAGAISRAVARIDALFYRKSYASR